MRAHAVSSRGCHTGAVPDADDHREVLSRPSRPADLTVGYGADADQVADVWLPPAGTPHPSTPPAPLLICVHGGFWRAAYDRRHLGPMAEALAADGYAVAAVEYRRMGQPGGGWPGTFDDLARCLDTLPGLVRSAAAERMSAGGRVAVAGRVAQGPPILLGHSAGGQLVLWAVARHRLPTGSPWWLPVPADVAAVVALAPVADLDAAHRLGLDEGAVDDLLGGGPADVPDRYAAVDPRRLGPPGSPVTVLHGTADRQVPIELSRRYADGVRSDGVAWDMSRRIDSSAIVTLRELTGVDHFALIDPRSPAFAVVRDTLAHRIGDSYV